MNSKYSAGILYHIAKADFLERSRSYSFLISLGICIFMIYSFVPPLDAGYRIVSLGNYRGFYNSAWIGSMVAMCTPFFALVCFYLVNYSVKRDTDTGVGQIIATTPVTGLQYLTGKFLSNFAVLLLITLLIAIMTIVMFLLRGETGSPEFGKLLLPLLVFLVPTMFIVSSLALFLESIPILSRGSANIIYFFLWILLISGSILIPYIDIFGLNAGMNEFRHSIAAVHTDWNGDFGVGIGMWDPRANHKIFTWEGMNFTSSIVLSRIYWMAAAFGLVLISSSYFRRFDSPGIYEREKGNSLFSGKDPAIPDKSGKPSKIRYRDLPVADPQFSYLSLIVAELRLILKGNSTLWLFITPVLFILSIFTSQNFAYKITLPLLWFFQILILSGLGSREFSNRCHEYIFSAALPLKRQLTATMSAAALIMILLAIPVIIKLLVSGDHYGVYAILVGAIFVPVFAVSMGIVTGGRKVFEVLFTVIIYSIFDGIPFLDCTGAVNGSREMGIAHYFFAFTLVLIILAFFVRRWQIRHI
jgi:hypothetical protein